MSIQQVGLKTKVEYNTIRRAADNGSIGLSHDSRHVGFNTMLLCK